MFRSVFALSVLASAGLAALAVPAVAGPFGGFSSDHSRYLSGRDQVCTPVPVPASRGAEPATLRATPRCQAADERAIAAGGFRQGTPQSGSRATYEVTARGTELSVRVRRTQQPLLTWQSIDPIAAVRGVYLDEPDPGRPPTAPLLAVEYELRFGGRARVEVIAFALPASGAQAAAPSPGPDVAPGPGPGAGASAEPPALSADLSAQLDKARKLDARKRARPAEAAYREALALAPDNAEARYGLARNLARQRKLPAARAELETLARSRAPDAVVWLVEARFDQAFAKLRSDPGFRAATGLERDPAAPRSLYERLLGFSEVWEQPEIKCEQAQVRLDMKRRARSFALRITSRCGGSPFSLRLKGRFELTEPARVLLRMPNPGGEEDVVACQLDTCSGEDCLRCAVDQDLSFTVLPVRR